MTNIGGLADGGWDTAVARCPKHMAHGPCAGVCSDGACEVPAFGECSFLSALGGDWPLAGGPNLPTSRQRPLTGRSARFAATAATRPVVVVDLPTPALSATGLPASADVLADSADAYLLGDHGRARVQFPPSYRARLLADAGLSAWVGLNCRDRNRVAIEGEIAACLDADVAGLHCVTGDHPELGHRRDAMPVFDLDSVDVVVAARDRGTLCSVAHAPSSPPVRPRLPRLLTKIAAGADVVFVDHCGGPGPAADAVGQLRATGFTGLVLICVPVVTSPATAEVIESFASGRLPDRYLSDILGAPDVARAGIDAAAELSAAMLAIPGVSGINLSGGTEDGQEISTAREMAEIARRILGAGRLS